MPVRISAKTRQLRLARSLSARSATIARLATTEHRAVVWQMKLEIPEEQLAQRNTSGSVTPNSTRSQTRRVWVFLWTAALLLLLILLAWTALVQSSKQESSRWLLCGPTPSLQVGGLSTSEGLKLSFKSAELDISKLNPRSKKHETVQGQFP